LALSPGTLAAGDVRWFLARLEQAFGAGLPGFLLREKGLSDGAYDGLLCEVLTVRERAFPEAWIGVHDRVHLALASPVDGVHLGSRSLSAEQVRALAGGSLRIGFSAHAGDEARDLSACDYLFLSPVRRTGSKPDATPLGFGGLASFVERCERPTFALGGIEPKDVSGALEQGAHGVAVLSGLLGAEDVEGATRSYLAELG